MARGAQNTKGLLFGPRSKSQATDKTSALAERAGLDYEQAQKALLIDDYMRKLASKDSMSIRLGGYGSNLNIQFSAIGDFAVAKIVYRDPGAQIYAEDGVYSDHPDVELPWFDFCKNDDYTLAVLKTMSGAFLHQVRNKLIDSAGNIKATETQTKVYQGLKQSFIEGKEPSALDYVEFLEKFKSAKIDSKTLIDVILSR